MTRDIEVEFIGGPNAGRGSVAVNNGARLPERITVHEGSYRFNDAGSTWDGEYHYRNPEYRFEPR
ncbi:hypothetical protein [Microbacterium sp. NPDC087589]|uniref:hypothetical protein n=1 Tax=Microbacterium sp. NPDC087589 TaxID=3364191 RepID=UPI00382BB753